MNPDRSASTHSGPPSSALRLKAQPEVAGYQNPPPPAHLSMSAANPFVQHLQQATTSLTNSTSSSVDTGGGENTLPFICPTGVNPLIFMQMAGGGAGAGGLPKDQAFQSGSNMGRRGSEEIRGMSAALQRVTVSTPNPTGHLNVGMGVGGPLGLDLSTPTPAPAAPPAPAAQPAGVKAASAGGQKDNASSGFARIIRHFGGQQVPAGSLAATLARMTANNTVAVGQPVPPAPGAPQGAPNLASGAVPQMISADQVQPSNSQPCGLQQMGMAPFLSLPGISSSNSSVNTQESLPGLLGYGHLLGSQVLKSAEATLAAPAAFDGSTTGTVGSSQSGQSLQPHHLLPVPGVPQQPSTSNGSGPAGLAQQAGQPGVAGSLLSNMQLQLVLQGHLGQLILQQQQQQQQRGASAPGPLPLLQPQPALQPQPGAGKPVPPHLSMHRESVSAGSAEPKSPASAPDLAGTHHHLGGVVPNAPSLRTLNNPHRAGMSSSYLGVTWYKASKRWQARLCSDNKKYHLGYYNTEEEAARAYDRAVLRFKGPNAPRNFQDSILLANSGPGAADAAQGTRAPAHKRSRSAGVALVAGPGGEGGAGEAAAPGEDGAAGAEEVPDMGSGPMYEEEEAHVRIQRARMQMLAEKQRAAAGKASTAAAVAAVAASVTGAAATATAAAAAAQTTSNGSAGAGAAATAATNGATSVTATASAAAAAAARKPGPYRSQRGTSAWPLLQAACHGEIGAREALAALHPDGPQAAAAAGGAAQTADGSTLPLAAAMQQQAQRQGQGLDPPQASFNSSGMLTAGNNPILLPATYCPASYSGPPTVFAAYQEDALSPPGSQHRSGGHTGRGLSGSMAVGSSKAGSACQIDSGSVDVTGTITLPGTAAAAAAAGAAGAGVAGAGHEGRAGCGGSGGGVVDMVADSDHEDARRCHALEPKSAEMTDCNTAPLLAKMSLDDNEDQWHVEDGHPSGSSQGRPGGEGSGAAQGGPAFTGLHYELMGRPSVVEGVQLLTLLKLRAPEGQGLEGQVALGQGLEPADGGPNSGPPAGPSVTFAEWRRNVHGLAGLAQALAQRGMPSIEEEGAMSRDSSQHSGKWQSEAFMLQQKKPSSRPASGGAFEFLWDGQALQPAPK